MSAHLESMERVWLRVLDYIAEVGACQTQEEFLQTALVRIEKLIPYDVQAGIFEISGPCIKSIGPPENVNRIYREYYRFRLPWFDGKPSVPPARLMGVHLIDYDNEWPDSEFVRDFLPQTGAKNQMSSTFLNDTHVINICRSRHVHGFTDAELLLLSAITPHIKNLHTIFRRLSQKAWGEAMCEAVAETFPRLSRRETEIAAFVCQGLTSAEIATRLIISRRTVEAHLSHVFDKLEVRNRSALRRHVRSRFEDRGTSGASLST
jgi:DNA-binding CsgD family transcriptional regulator